MVEGTLAPPGGENFWIALYLKPMNWFEKFKCKWVHRDKNLHLKGFKGKIAPPGGASVPPILYNDGSCPYKLTCIQIFQIHPTV